MEDPTSAFLQPTKAADFLSLARAAVSGSREQTHGNKHLNMSATGLLIEALNNAVALTNNATGTYVPPEIYAPLIMIQVKISRILCGTYNPDDFVDLAGYAAVAGEVAAQNHRLRPLAYPVPNQEA